MSDLITAIDRRGLIRDSFALENPTAAECRSIFLDWALFDDHEMPQSDRIKALLNHYGKDNPGHPMAEVLRSALTDAAKPKRRGGWRARER